MVLMLLAFLSLVGGALLTSTTLDLRIGANYRTKTQLLFLAEAGIEAGRAALKDSANDLSTDLGRSAGTDGILSTSRDLTTLLSSDDRPLLPGAVGLRTTGESQVDPTGRRIGTYHVFMRNDPADGETITADSNNVVTLLSIARIGEATLTIEADVQRGRFPPIPAALTLDGKVGLFHAADSSLFQIDGNDQAGSGNDENAIGVISIEDETVVKDAIPDESENNYAGNGNRLPPPADVADISAELRGRLTTVSGVESLVSAISSSATDTYEPGFGNAASIGDIGGPTDSRVVVVDGDANVGPGTGFGMLLVRGVLTVRGNFSWHGLILVIGQGELRWNGPSNGEVQGGVFIAKTRNDDEDASNPFGTVSHSRGSVIADFNGGGGNGIRYNTSMIDKANGNFAYSPIAIREY